MIGYNFESLLGVYNGEQFGEAFNRLLPTAENQMQNYISLLLQLRPKES